MTGPAIKPRVELYCNKGYGDLAPTREFHIAPDALGAAVSYLVKNWGEYGYSVRGVTNLGPRTWLVHFGASDGSRFGIVVDRWGNVRDVPEHATADDVIDIAGQLERN